MIWTQIFMRTAVIFLVTMTTIARGQDTNAETWTQLVDGATVGELLVLEADECRLYGGGWKGIFISEDCGHNWIKTSFEGYASTIAISGDSVFAGTTIQGVFRSDDGGWTWIPIRDGLRFNELPDGFRYYAEVRHFLSNRGEVIAVMNYGGTYTSTDLGETWQNVSKKWFRGDNILTITEFDGYLWAAGGSATYRSNNNGQTWETLPRIELRGYETDWAVLDNRLYLAGEGGIGRWNENTLTWEYLMEGFPTGKAFIHSLAVHHGRLYTGLGGWGTRGVYVFDAREETWYSVGLDEFRVFALLSHQSYLYASTVYDDGTIQQREPIMGIYRARFPKLQVHGKALTRWARVKQGILALPR
ncbi:MAG: hypothetical protein OXT74_07870 [Candidatus Poribacteria bacterium]|nr:hypothetical protein [Candidatus Poribacteria bacterium]